MASNAHKVALDHAGTESTGWGRLGTRDRLGLAGRSSWLSAK